MKRLPEYTDYSETIPGDVGNHHRAVRYDVTSGYVGITVLEGDEVPDRVLLSPAQLKALQAFLRQERCHG
jgi:hypothetical protein